MYFRLLERRVGPQKRRLWTNSPASYFPSKELELIGFFLVFFCSRLGCATARLLFWSWSAAEPAGSGLSAAHMFVCPLRQIHGMCMVNFSPHVDLNKFCKEVWRQIFPVFRHKSYRPYHAAQFTFDMILVSTYLGLFMRAGFFPPFF